MIHRHPYRVIYLAIGAIFSAAAWRAMPPWTSGSATRHAARAALVSSVAGLAWPATLALGVLRRRKGKG